MSRHDLTLLSPKHQAKFKPSHLSVHKHREGFPGGTVVKVCLPMQETWVRSLIREDPTCCRATKPVRHSRRAGALEPGSCNYGALALDIRGPSALEPRLRSKKTTTTRSPSTATGEWPLLPAAREKAKQQRRLSTVKTK